MVVVDLYFINYQQLSFSPLPGLVGATFYAT